jgi:hypothetical protein
MDDLREEFTVNSQRFAVLLLLLVTSAILSGCHCLPITERYSDGIDRIADHEGHLMPNNIPRLDVTRWGMWDGPAWCRKGCR